MSRRLRGLFGAQGDDGIERYRTAGRDGARRQRGRHEHDAGSRVGERIQRSDAEDERRHLATDDDGTGQAEAKPDRDISEVTRSSGKQQPIAQYESARHLSPASCHDRWNE